MPNYQRVKNEKLWVSFNISWRMVLEWNQIVLFSVFASFACGKSSKVRSSFLCFKVAIQICRRNWSSKKPISSVFLISPVLALRPNFIGSFSASKMRKWIKLVRMFSKQDLHTRKYDKRLPHWIWLHMMEYLLSAASGYSLTSVQDHFEITFNNQDLASRFTWALCVPAFSFRWALLAIIAKCVWALLYQALLKCLWAE